MELLQIYHPQIPGFLSRLSRTEEMLRLKGVGMDCGCEYTDYPAYRGCPPASRYEHSLGVALIIWHFTGSRKQAIAGLFHDISTPVFSHTVDFLNRDYMQQESTEAGTREIIGRSGRICALLEEYGVSQESVRDYHRYPIADNDSPRLSADRLEYTLRNFMRYEGKTLEEVRRFYEDLAVCENEDGQEELAFLHAEIAEEFALLSLRASLLFISDSDRYSMQYLADLLRSALSAGALAPGDLHTTEPGHRKAPVPPGNGGLLGALPLPFRNPQLPEPPGRAWLDPGPGQKALRGSHGLRPGTGFGAVPLPGGENPGISGDRLRFLDPRGVRSAGFPRRKTARRSARPPRAPGRLPSPIDPVSADCSQNQKRPSNPHRNHQHAIPVRQNSVHHQKQRGSGNQRIPHPSEQNPYFSTMRSAVSCVNAPRNSSAMFRSARIA